MARQDMAPKELTDRSLSDEIADLLKAAHAPAESPSPPAEGTPAGITAAINGLVLRRISGLEAAVVRLATEIEQLKGYSAGTGKS